MHDSPTDHGGMVAKRAEAPTVVRIPRPALTIASPYAQGWRSSSSARIHPRTLGTQGGSSVQPKRRELAKLLVQRITIGRNEEGRPEVKVAYRFGPPAAAQSANGVQNSEEFSRAHGQGGGEGLLRGHPKITIYEVAVEREAERYYGPD